MNSETGLLPSDGGFMNYQAAVFRSTNTIRLASKQLKDPGPQEVLVKIRACGVCGSDIHLFHGTPASADATPPVVLGHEFAGEVAAIGIAVSDFQPGDQVTVDPNISCGACWYCRNGERHLCANLTAIGVNFDGGFAEYCVVPAIQVYRFNRKIPFHHAAMSEPVACCLHGIDRVGMKEGQTVAVAGCGAIGLIMIQLSLLGGASRVYASDPIEKRRNLALSLGAIPVDPRQQPLPEAVRSDNPEGVDISIECAGNPGAMMEAMKSLRRGGTGMFFSVPDVDAVLELPSFELFFRELTIMGSFVNPATQGRAVNLIASGKIQLEPLVTHRLPLDSINEAFQIFGNSEVIKIMITL